MDIDFILDEIEYSKANGEQYLKTIDFNVPLRIQNELKNKHFKSELDFYKCLEERINLNKSFYLFPSNICFFYPSTTSHIASKEYSCMISGIRINRGERYCCYRPLLENYTKKKVYTLRKTLIISEDYESYLPKDLWEFEEWYQNLEKHLYQENSQINFYDFACNAGDNALNLREFSNRKEKIKIKK